MVVIDTDVLLLELAYPRDKRFAANAAFFTRAAKADPAITIYNLMELLGQLSFNLLSSESNPYTPLDRADSTPHRT